MVTSVEPLRAYLFKGGVLPFGTLKDASSRTATCSANGELMPLYQSGPADAFHYFVVTPEAYIGAFLSTRRAAETPAVQFVS